MKKPRKLFLTALLSLAGALWMPSAAAEVDYTRFVNPRIGTGGHGHVFLGANVPFGYVQLGPTQPTRGWDWCSGYHHSDSVLIGFGHQHLSGTGIGDLGDVALLPIAHEKQRQTKFSHASETVSPGYYAVKLAEPNVLVELTATKRVGMHRYTFGGDQSEALIMLDLRQGIGWDHVSQCQMTQESPTVVTGYRHSVGWARRQKDFFVAEFSRPVELTKVDGDTTGILTVKDIAEPLLVKVALSAVSVENAKLNLQKELPDWNFQKTVAAARKAWNDELSKIQIAPLSSPEGAMTIFYTALYHTMIAPSVFNDVNGEYRGADGKIHKGNFTNYTTLSLWDTYRAAHPLQTLIHPEKQADIAQTFLNIFNEQGKLPVWHLMGNETDCMVGNPGIPVLADLVLKGFFGNLSIEKAYEAMKTSAMLDERGMNLLKEYGYLPFDKDDTNETVAKGLEYALADWCVAQVAKKLGKKADFQYFMNRSKLYQKHFDQKDGFIKGLSSTGERRKPFNPFHSAHRADDFTEGNAWQYTWLVPHDVHGLVKTFGSEGKFLAKFDSLFIVSGDLGKDASPDISGLIGQYAHGNEPSHHILYMYNYVGQPWKGARLLRQTMREMYSDDFDGLSGNEDVGQMSAWYVLSAIGLYQVEPAGGKFIIGSPAVGEATLSVGNGKTFTVKATDNSEENIYVQRALLNGKPYTKSYILFSDILRGGTLELQMGPQPGNFGTKKKDRP
ncbi:MAG: GH92 family glycosyl hydrolase [Prevotella sp.]|nr:GH92 family glycosyl hydrolase [Prevotella sp.]